MKLLLIATAIIASSAFGKITIFSNADAISQVVNGKYLYKFYEQYTYLRSPAELVSVSVKQNKQKFDLSLVFKGVESNGSKWECTIATTTESIVSTTSGITSSRLSEPNYSKPSCSADWTPLKGVTHLFGQKRSVTPFGVFEYVLGMPKLFVVLLGGKAPGANVELHDVVFIAGESIETLHPQLKEKWFGTKQSAHLDSWMEVQWADGYDVKLVEGEKSFTGQDLYFLNIGSYPPGRLEETHTYTLLVGDSDKEVKERAKQLAPNDHQLPHKDNQLLVDDILKISVPGFHIELTPSPISKGNPLFSDYVPL